MTSVKDAVTQVVENSEFAQRGLREGVLNMSAYARLIRPQVEKILKKDISDDSSIVMALSRYGREMKRSDFREGYSNKTEVIKIIYRKTPETQERLAMLLLLDAVKRAPFLTVTIDMIEVAITANVSLADIIKGHFGNTVPNDHLVFWINPAGHDRVY